MTSISMIFFGTSRSSPAMSEAAHSEVNTKSFAVTSSTDDHSFSAARRTILLLFPSLSVTFPFVLLCCSLFPDYYSPYFSIITAAIANMATSPDKSKTAIIFSVSFLSHLNFYKVHSEVADSIGVKFGRFPPYFIYRDYQIMVISSSSSSSSSSM